MNDKLPVPAAITNFELQTVSTQIDLLNNKKIYVEIGSKFGGSLLYFGRLMPENSKLIAIDLPGGPWGHPESVRSLEMVASVLRSENYKVNLIYGDSKDIETEIKLKLILGNDLIDILFIDGDHTLYGVASDIKIYTKYVRPGGMVIFHDCGDIKALSTDLNSFKTIKSVRSAFDDFSYGKKKLIVQEHWGVGIVWV